MNRKSKGFITVATIFLLSACLSNQKNSATRNNKDMIIDSIDFMNSPYHFNIGTFSKKDQSTVDYELILTNKSSHSIIINSVDVNCGCVNINEYPELIKSGDKGSLKGFIDIQHQNGHISKPLFISYNNNNLLLVRLIGTIKE